MENMRSQFVTASNFPTVIQNQKTNPTQGKGNLSAIPYVFTEHGGTMVASILRSKRAVEMNIEIVRAFISLRQMTMQRASLSIKIEQIRTEIYMRLDEHDSQLSAIYEAIKSAGR